MALVIGAFMTLMALMKVAISLAFGDAARFDLSFPAWLVCSWGTAGLVAGPIAACLPISRRAARIMHAVLFSYLSAAIFSLLVHLERDTEVLEILLGSVVFGSLTLLVAYLVQRASAKKTPNKAMERTGINKVPAERASRESSSPQIHLSATALRHR